MANTTYLKKDVEEFLRRWTSQRLGVALIKKRVEVGPDSEGRPVSFEFDGVSTDETIGVFISASSSYKTGQMRKYFMEATLLNRVTSFKRRIMVFINEIAWHNFKNQCDGLIDLDRIEPLICSELPANMKSEIERIYTESALEVGNKSGPGKAVHARRS